MIEAIGSAITPAIAIALSPVPVVFIVLVLASPRGRANGPAFALGWFLGACLVTGAVVLLAGEAVEDDGAYDTGVNVLQALLGGLFLGLAVKTWRGRPRPGVDAPTPALFSKVAELGPSGAFATGFALVVLNLKNLPLSISSGLSIAQHDDLTGPSAVLAVVAFGLLASSSVVVLVLYALVAGERSRAPLEGLEVWLLDNKATILVVLLTLLGAYQVSEGLTGGA